MSKYKVSLNYKNEVEAEDWMHAWERMQRGLLEFLCFKRLDDNVRHHILEALAEVEASGSETDEPSYLGAINLEGNVIDEAEDFVIRIELVEESST